MDEGKAIGAIYIDVRKVFDSVSHVILHHKLQACGISGKLNCWLQSYLASRMRAVRRVKWCEFTSTRSSEYGVLQESLLAPRLFSIYVNYFSESVSRGKVHLYADDTTAYVIGSSPNQGRSWPVFTSKPVVVTDRFCSKIP